MRVLVCGSRHLQDDAFVLSVLSTLNRKRGPITAIIHGGAKGADRFAGWWASDNGVKVRVFYAKWNDIHHPAAVVKHSLRSGKPYNVMAGFWRNQKMLKEGQPQLCVAFKKRGAANKGTQDMIDRCVKANVEVMEVWGS
jgi:hypothetical protein